MTRETKVGLVVATSFVCLVGVVIASRLGRKSEPPADQSIAQAALPKDPKKPLEENKPTSAPKPHETPPEKPSPQHPHEPAPAVPVKKNLDPSKPPAASPDPPGLPPLPPVPLVAQGPPVAPNIDSLFSPKIDKKEPGHDVTHDLDHEQKVKDQLAKLKNDAESSSHDKSAVNPPSAPPKPVEPAPLPTAATDQVVPITASPKDLALPPVPTKEELGGLPKPPALPDVVTLGQKDDGKAPLAEKAEKTEKAEKKAAFGEQPPLPPPPPAAPTDFISPSPSVEPPVAPPAPKQEVAAPKPSLVVKQAPKEDAAPQIGGFTVAPVASRPNKDTGLNSLPPAAGFSGQPAPSPAPAVVSKATGSQVKVTDWDILPYTCTPEDVSFESLSTRMYGSSKYAKALLQFNQEYPPARATLKGEDPRLQPNQQLGIPPKALLDARLARDTRPTIPTAATVPAISVDMPRNAALPNQLPGAVRAATPSSDATKPYRVPAQGQMIIEIAQQTLGDRGRWSEIYRLNPTLRPEFPIPGGTEVRLPASASAP
jgi:hypothetical protein